MGTTTSTSREDRLEKVWQALQAAQQLQEDRLNFGLDHVDLYVDNVEGDWLEHWGEDDEPVKLGRWLENIFESGWQVVEELFCTEEPSVAFSTAGVKRAKVIDLGMKLDGEDVALIVTIKPESDHKIGILVQVHPMGDEVYLPQGLKLVLLSPDWEVVSEVSARSAENVIQMEFEGEVGEEFSIQVALGDVSVRENFAI